MQKIFFGGASESILLNAFLNVSSKVALDNVPFNGLQKKFDLKSVVVLKQEHGVRGLVIDKDTDVTTLRLQTYVGDYLLTHRKNVGLAVLTADCLPIVFYDTVLQVIAVAHAGWRGSVQSIVTIVLNAMQKTYGCKVSDIQVSFGPCAKVCCYQINQKFIDNINDDEIAQSAILKTKKGLFFDMIAYNRLKLELAGISPLALHFDNNNCTMCTPGYCSFRVQNGTESRNITLVSLK